MPERIGFPVSLDGNPGCPVSGGAGWEDLFLCHLFSLGSLSYSLSKFPREGQMVSSLDASMPCSWSRGPQLEPCLSNYLG